MLIAQIDLLYYLAHFKIDLMDIDISLRKSVFAALLDDHEESHQPIEILIFEELASASIAFFVGDGLEVGEDSVLFEPSLDYCDVVIDDIHY